MAFWKKPKKQQLDPNRIPCHVAAIMDGNGRWAKQRGLPRTAGHSVGSESFRRAAEYLATLGVQHFTVYAFSTENWKRPVEEVQAIMGLLEKYLHEAIRDLAEKNIRLRFFGDMSPISPAIKELMAQTNAISAKNTGMTVNICLNYGGRDEIVRSVRKLAARCAAGVLDPDAITEADISAGLDSADIPDPDLVIRPGGELRISNFLLWQSAYSEFYFTDTFWPDMNQEELEKAILSYQSRNRRFGGV